jgi:hypothetical protein
MTLRNREKFLVISTRCDGLEIIQGFSATGTGISISVVTVSECGIRIFGMRRRSKTRRRTTIL